MRAYPMEGSGVKSDWLRWVGAGVEASRDGFEEVIQI